MRKTVASCKTVPANNNSSNGGQSRPEPEVILDLVIYLLVQTVSACCLKLETALSRCTVSATMHWGNTYIFIMCFKIFTKNGFTQKIQNQSLSTRNDPQNIFGASQQNSVAAFSSTTLVDGNIQNIKTYSSSGTFQVSRDSEIQNWFEKTLFTLIFSLNLHCSCSCPVWRGCMNSRE